MALKEKDGEFNGLNGDLYHQINNVNSLTFGDNPHVHFMKRVFSSEKFRVENPGKPLFIESDNFPLSKETADKIKAILYEELKSCEDYKDMIDC